MDHENDNTGKRPNGPGRPRPKRDAHDGLGMLPWYPADWLSSDTKAEADLETQAALRNLWDREWLSGDCTLPDDDQRLRTLAGATPECWDRIGIAVRQRFVPAGEGKLVNPRLLHEWKKARALRLAKRRAGQKGNSVRWGKDLQGIAEGSQGDRRGIAEGSPPTPSPSATANGNGRQAANPLIAGRRPEVELEGYRLIREINALEPEKDPTEILLEAARWEGRDGRARSKCRLETMSDDHLVNTLHDLRSILEDAKRGTKAAQGTA